MAVHPHRSDVSFCRGFDWGKGVNLYLLEQILSGGFARSILDDREPPEAKEIGDDALATALIGIENPRLFIEGSELVLSISLAAIENMTERNRDVLLAQWKRDFAIYAECLAGHVGEEALN